MRQAPPVIGKHYSRVWPMMPGNTPHAEWLSLGALQMGGDGADAKSAVTRARTAARSEWQATQVFSDDEEDAGRLSKQQIVTT